MRQFVLMVLTGLLISINYCLAQVDTKAPLPEDYQSCCGTQPVEFTYEKKQVYIPNVFTPNGDGVNDYFMPYINDEVGSVWGFTILSAKGDSVLYIMPYLDYSKEKEVARSGWNGRRKDGTQYKGLFKYRVRVDDRKTNKDVIEGSACAIVCGPEAKVFQTKEGCFYPVQVGEKGRKDLAKANQEKDCF